MASEFLTSKSNIFLDITFFYSLLLPFMQIASIYFAKAEKYDIHKRMQIIMLSFFIALILVTVMDINMIKKIIQQSSFANSTQLYTVFILYLITLVITIILWFWLILKSYDRYPIHFKFDHKKWGKMVFFGICLTSMLGILFYWMVSVL